MQIRASCLTAYSALKGFDDQFEKETLDTLVCLTIQWHNAHSGVSHSQTVAARA